MDDLISRQAAIDALAKFVPYAICDESTESYTNGLTDAYNLILQLPSAQPGITLESAVDYLHSIGWMQEHDRILTESAQTERKKGKWINANDGKWNTVEVLKCSVCGEMDNRMYRTDNYCPNCGADMRGETDDIS